MSVDMNQLLRLPLDERLQIVEELWESIVSSEEPISVWPWQKEELARRKENHLRNPEPASSWDEALKRLRGEDG
jgi:putative addiction module component (TIGR02574 family)